MSAPSLTIHDLATAKGFTAGQLTQFGIRNGQGGVVIPYFDADGHEYVKYKIRTATSGRNSFRWSSGDAPVLPYGLHKPIPYAKKFVWVVEGESDCWTLWLNKLPGLGLPGATSTGCLKLEHVADCVTVAVVTEPDKAGSRFPHRVAQQLYDLGFAGQVCAVSLPFKDVRETAIQSGSPAGFRKALEAAYRARTPIERASMKLPNLNVRLLSNVTPEEVRWLWNQRIPIAKPCVMAGDGGEGKSFLSLGIAAAVTTGASLPGGSHPESGEVLIWNGEDGPEDTIYARASMCGAALNRIHVIDDVNENGKRVSFGLRHIGQLDEYLSMHPNINFAVLDPITALLLNVDGKTDTEVRSALQPLAEIAYRRRVAIMMVMHLRKTEGMKVLHKVSGSVAFGALGRSVMYVGTHAVSGRKSIDTIKHNLAICKPEPVEFRLDERDGVVWVGLCNDLDASTIESSYGARKRVERPGMALTFLRDMLANGPVDSKQIYEAATLRGFDGSILRTTKESLGVVSYRVGEGLGSCWFWKMPGHDEPNRHLFAVPDATYTNGATTSTNGTTAPDWVAQAHKFFDDAMKSESSQGSLFSDDGESRKF